MPEVSPKGFLHYVESLIVLSLKFRFLPTFIKKAMNVLFFLFSSLAVFCGIMVIQCRNPVHSVLFLICVFINAAALLILLGLDFFALILLVVYVGAIAVLFLFVVMMLDIKIAEISEKKLRYLPVGGLLGFLFLGEMVCVISTDLEPYPLLNLKTWADISPFYTLSWSSLGFYVTPLESVGRILYTYYFHLFLIASCVLLVAMIGAIVLTLHKGYNIHRQAVFLQNTREFTGTVSKYK